jgi:hypothetical protein
MAQKEIKMRATQTFAGDEGLIPGGQEFITTEQRAKVLERRNFGERVQEPKAKRKHPHANKATGPSEDK